MEKRNFLLCGPHPCFYLSTTIFTHFPSHTQTLSTIQVMGNYRFRFSDMIPNAWFYKLRGMNKIRNLKTNTSSSSLSSFSSSSSSLTAKDHTSSQKPHLSEQRKSYYFTRDPPIKARASGKPPPVEPPRKSSRRRRSTKRSRRPPIVSSSISAGCSCRATLWTKPSSPSSSEHDSILTEYGSDRLSWSSSCKCRTENDIVFDMVNDGNANPPFNQPDYLPPIITKKPEPTKIERTSAEFSEKNKFGSLSVKVVKENFVSTASPLKRFSVTSSSPGVKLRTNSPRIAHRRVQGRRSVSSNSSSGTSRRSVTESFAVVKSSKDPGRDFRESMMEMIVENNITASKDLEELLACYLSLNSDEYHDLIINVFKQIWFDFIHLRLK